MTNTLLQQEGFKEGSFSGSREKHVTYILYLLVYESGDTKLGSSVFFWVLDERERLCEREKQIVSKRLIQSD